MSAQPPPVLQVRDLSVTFSTDAGPLRAVRSLSYEVKAGEIFGLVGESGSGKSASSLAVMNLLPATAVSTGSVAFKGSELLGKTDRELSAIRGKKIAMIFQDPLSALTPVYSVGDQVAEAIQVHEKVSKDAALDRAIELLNVVGIPNARVRARSFPHEFSGGMRQRVVIAMAIANKPDLIIADEPTTALDVTIQAQIIEVLLEARRITGASIVMITHDLGIIAGIADRVGVMYAGTLVELGDVDEIFYRSRMPYTRGLLASIPRLDRGKRSALKPIDGAPPSLVNPPRGCPFEPRCPVRIEICKTSQPDLLQVGDPTHLAACHRSEDAAALIAAAPVAGEAPDLPAARSAPEAPRSNAHTVLEVRDLVKTYPIMKGGLLRRAVGRIAAVDGISFDIREGETLALVGESGCGKTSTILEVLNLGKPAGGTIVVLGKRTDALSSADQFRIRRELQIVFQDPMASLDPRMPIGDILEEPLETHGVAEPERSRRVSELLLLVGLQEADAERFPHEFSGGQKQRINIARALALSPKVVVLDEPVSALDVSIRAGILNLLEDLREKQKLSYLFVAHDLSVVRHLADRVAVMYQGKIVEIGEVNQVFESPMHPYTQALLSAIPIPDPQRERARKRILLQGDVPAHSDTPKGCRFSMRCPRFARELSEAEQSRCITELPALLSRSGSDDHLDACHYAAPYSVV